jgi:gliding motility-associated-like protein
MCRDAAAVPLTAVTPGGVWSGTGVVGSTFDPVVSGAGTFTITYTIGGMCGDVDTYDVTVYDLPVIVPTAFPDQGCVPLQVDFVNAGTGSGTCVWNFGDGITATSCAAIMHEYTTPGVYTPSLTITDANGCVNTGTGSVITVYELPKAYFTWNPQIPDIADPVVQFTDLSDLAVTWDWTMGFYTGSTEQHPTVEFNEVKEYLVTLKVTSAGGCEDQITQLVEVVDVIVFFIPNTFTPDGDGANDDFRPAFTSGIDIFNFNFKIFNRWGEIVWESYDPQIGWDGTYSDRGLIEDGTYVWQLEFTETMSDKVHKHRGHVTILK